MGPLPEFRQAQKTLRERFPDSPVDYVVADLLDPPPEPVGPEKLESTDEVVGKA